MQNIYCLNSYVKVKEKAMIKRNKIAQTEYVHKTDI